VAFFVRFGFGEEGWMSEGEFISCGSAAKRLGVAPMTLRQRVRRGEVPVFLDPLDARVRLLRRDDVEQLAKRDPRPAQGAQLAESSAA
jgi:hypothetical protein